MQRIYITASPKTLRRWVLSECEELISLWSYRSVISVILKRNIYIEFHQTLLGPLWLIIQPILQSVIFTLIFGKLAKISTDGVDSYFFYNLAILSWSLYTSISGTSAGILLQNKSLMSKIYIPKLLFPLSNYIFRFFQFFINFMIFYVLYLSFSGFDNIFHFNIFQFLIGIIFISINAIFAGLLVAAVTTVKRDLQHIYTYFMQALMYLSPVIYPLSTLPKKYLILSSFNPIAVGIEMIRSAVFNSPCPDLLMVIIASMVTLILFIVSYILYARAYINSIDYL